MAMITISTIKERWKLSITASFMGCIIPVLFLNHSHDSTNLSALLGIRMEPSEPSKLNKHSDSALQNTSTSPTSFGQFPTPNVEFSQISKLTGFPDSAPQIMNTSVLFSEPPRPNTEFSEPPRPNTEFSEPSKPKMEFSGPSKLTDYPSSALQNTTTSTLSFDQFPRPDMETARPEMEISEPSKPNMDFHEPSKIIENPKLMNHSNEKCDIFDGKWVYDPEGKPLYGPQCPFLHDQVSCRRNGRPDSDYEKWSWQPNECEIPRFNVTDMFERLRGKRLIMVGDSLNGNMWASLACLLYSAIPSSRSHIETNRIPRSFRSKDYNCSVEFYMNPFLVQTYVNKTDGTRVLRLDQISDSARRWQGADIMVFNTGHWWMHKGRFQSWDLFQYKGKLVEEMKRESAFGMGLRTWARWVDRYVDRTKTRVFFRSLSPQHSGQHYCYNQSQPILDEFLLPPFPNPMARIVEGRIRRMRTPVRYLNITKLSQYRKDAHPSIYSSKREKLMINHKQSPDCSHWCLPGLPDTWNMLLYVSMVSSNSSSWHLMV